MGGDGTQKESTIPGKVRKILKQDFPEDNNWLQPKQLLGLPWRFAIAMQEKGWILRNSCIWHKPNHMPSSVKDRFGNSYEYVFMFVKSRKYFFNLDAIRIPYEYPMDVARRIKEDLRDNINPFQKGQEGANWRFGFVHKELGIQKSHFNVRVRDSLKGKSHQYHASEKEIAEYKRKQAQGFYKKYSLRSNHGGDSSPDDVNPLGKNPGDVWTITTRPHPFAHFACFPEELAEKCLKAGCPKRGLVLDPFMGSGTVAVVAKRLGMNYLGFELNPEYVKIADLRLQGFNLWKELKPEQRTL